jgi:hypothetical protein
MATIEKEIQVSPNYANRQEAFIEESVHGSLSPYDIPNKITVRYDPKHNYLMIQFRYMTPNEPQERVRSIDDVFLDTGKFTGKLYTAQVKNVRKGGVPAALEEVRLALQKRQRQYRIESPVDKAPLLNFIMLEDLLSVIKDSTTQFDLAEYA